MPDKTYSAIPALHELEMFSPWFDESSPKLHLKETGEIPIEQTEIPRRLLLIVSAPRNGSYHLCRLLWQMRYGRPTEYFNPFFHAELRRFNPKRNTVRQVLKLISNQIRPKHIDPAWLTQLVNERTAHSRISGTPYFSAKLQPDQFGSLRTILATTFAPLAQKKIWLPFEQQPPLLVLLYRRDWKATVISHHLARCTGSYDQGRITTVQHRTINEIGQRSTLLEDLTECHRQLKALTTTLETINYPIHCVAFETILENQTKALAAIIRKIDDTETSTIAIEQHPALAFCIERQKNPWANHQKEWQVHLYQRLEEENLWRHPDAKACALLIDQLETAAMPINR